MDDGVLFNEALFLILKWLCECDFDEKTWLSNEGNPLQPGRSGFDSCWYLYDLFSTSGQHVAKITL